MLYLPVRLLIRSKRRRDVRRHVPSDWCTIVQLNSQVGKGKSIPSSLWTQMICPRVASCHTALPTCYSGRWQKNTAYNIVCTPCRNMHYKTSTITPMPGSDLFAKVPEMLQVGSAADLCPAGCLALRIAQMHLANMDRKPVCLHACRRPSMED
jgi:hypothetical protein